MILHVVDSGGLYGIERMLLSLLPKLRDRGCEVTLAAMGSPGTRESELGDALAARGVPVSYLGFAGKASAEGLLALHRTVSRLRPKVVHSHGYKANTIAGTYGLLRQIPAVSTYHAEALKAHDVARYIRLETPIVRRLDAIVAVSDPIREELQRRGVRADRIHVIPNGIDDPAEECEPGARDLKPTGPRLAVVGRLVEGKNVHRVLDVVGRLRSEFPAMTVEIAGDGPCRADLEAQASRLGIAHAVHFRGFVEDVHALLCECDIFVLPSRTEGMPIALLEAMSCSAAIVSSAVGSIPSVVRHEKDALLIPPDDDEALLTSVQRLARDATLRKSLAANARRRFETAFTSDRMASAYQDFYRSLLTSRGRSFN